MRIDTLANGVALLAISALALAQAALAQTGGVSKEQLRRGQYLATS
jgi:hypothetical protein